MTDWWAWTLAELCESAEKVSRWRTRNASERNWGFILQSTGNHSILVEWMKNENDLFEKWIQPIKKGRKEEGKHLAWYIRNCQNHPVVHFWEWKKMSERCKERTVAHKNDWMRKRKLVLAWGGWRDEVGSAAKRMSRSAKASNVITTQTCLLCPRNRQGLYLAQSSGSTDFLFRVSDVFLHKAGFLLERPDFRSHISRHRKADAFLFLLKSSF